MYQSLVRMVRMSHLPAQLILRYQGDFIFKAKSQTLMNLQNSYPLWQLPEALVVMPELMLCL